MIRMVLAALIGLTLGIGGGIAASWLRGRTVPPTTAMAADSAAIAVGDSAAVADSSAIAIADMTAAAVAVCPHVAAKDSTATSPDTVPALTPKTAAPMANADPVAAVTDSIRAQRERLVRIMGAMKPADAARALVPLDDAQVEAVLFGMTERKAAAILGSFPAERAATLMRSILNRRQN